MADGSPSSTPRIRLGVRPGPGTLMFVMLSLVVGAATVWFQQPLLYWGAGVLIAALVVSAVWAPLSLRSVEVKRFPPSHGAGKEALRLQYRLKHRGRWLPAFGVVIEERWTGRSASHPMWSEPRRLRARPIGWVMHIGPNQTMSASAPCWPLRRGELRLETVRLSSSFPFGILKVVTDHRQPAEVLVYPALHRLGRGVTQRLTQIDLTAQRLVNQSGGVEEFFGLREYRPGDSLRFIDWKASAKSGKAITREMTRPAPPRMMVHLDLRRSPGASGGGSASAGGSRRRRGREAAREAERAEESIEAAVSLAASLICEGYLSGCQIGLAVQGVDAEAFSPHHSLPHRTRLLEALALLDTSRRGRTLGRSVGTPTVVVRPDQTSPAEGEGGGEVGGDSSGAAEAGPEHLSARHLEEAVVPVGEDGAASVLSRRVRPTSRRSALQERGGWR